MYRFDLRGHAVSCDSVGELVAALSTATVAVSPTSAEKRARRTDARAAPVRDAWRIAKLYAEYKGLTPGEARTYLKEHPQAKTRFENAL